MSKSRRKIPYIRQERKDCHYLNKKVRRSKLADIPSGGYYRKIYKSGYDWSYIWTREQAMQDYNTNIRLQQQYTLEQWINEWERWALRK